MSDLRDYRDQALAYLKRVKTSVKQYALNLTDLEVKVEEATNNEPWGPHGKLMHEICGCAWRDNESYRQIMGVLARRLEDKDQNWRHVYKSLLLLEHLIKNGPPKLIDELRANLDVIQRLKFFEYVDKKGKDHGLNVRNRAQLLVSLLQDDETIRMERSKARANAAKYGGVSSDQMRFSSRNHSFEDSYHGMSQGSASFNSAPAYDRPHDPTAPYSKWASSSYSASKFEDAPTMEEEGQTTRYAQQEDPIEMTRARIEKMKMEGHFEEQPQETHDDVTRKRLSNTKIKPEISQTFSSIKVAPATESRGPMPPVTLHSTQQAEVNLLDLDSPVEHPSTSNEMDPFAQLAAKAVQNESNAEPSEVEEEDDEDFFQSVPPLAEETLGVDADDGFGAFTVAGKGGSTSSPGRMGPPKPASTRQPIDLDDLLGAQGTTKQQNASASPAMVQYPPGGAGNMGQFNQPPGVSASESPLKALGLPESGSSPIHFERDHKLGSSPSKDPFAGIAGI